MTKLNNNLLTIVLAGIVGTVALNATYRFWLYNIACAGSKIVYEGNCSLSATLRSMGERAIPTPDDKHKCWCARAL